MRIVSERQKMSTIYFAPTPNGRCFVHSFFYTQFRYKIHTKVLKQPKSLQKGPALEYRLDLLGTYCNMKGTIFFIVFYTNFTSETPTKVL